MSELLPMQALAKKNFDFVDTIRCISMIGIVFEHSSVLWNDIYANTGDRIIQASVMQFFKFATIAFFLIGGFLINHKFTEYTPFEYIKNRFRNTIGPWIFWIAVLIILNAIHAYYVHLKFGNPQVVDAGFIASQLKQIIFYSSFWFILNFLICISILLIFKKYIYKLGFGIIWGLISLFYSLNLYYGWIVTEHSTALFGFVFYLWLGVYMNRYYDKVSVYIHKISWFWMIIINLLCFALSNIEIIHLMDSGSKDAFNTLRITNIIYSLSMFALLLKIGPLKRIQDFLMPRQTTFGIYLLHQILIIRLLAELFRPGKFDVMKMSVLEATGYTIVRFSIIYSLSFILVYLILKTKFKWAIGAK